MTKDQEFAKMLLAMLPRTSVTNDPASLKKALELHEWLTELSTGRSATAQVPGGQ